ncbi:hypothetical protein ANN_22262 [Periplaneta americana]|uniref:Uncharacterized protein n=1 Tax=Periplaneta americana TaxID=6978 RepID=A0ABQ8S848_PERAM|nr:hypothetical protein ANN_22262 [Periplaneta americana]
MTAATTAFGRPQKSFSDSSERSKTRKTQGLRETVDTEELTFATQMKLRACGKPDASKVLKEITKSPKRATKYRKAYSSSLQEKEGSCHLYKLFLCLWKQSCNLDIINRLLRSSDPLLTSMRPTQRKRTIPFLKETTEMLLPSLFTISADRNEDDESASEAEESSDEESWE